MDAPRHDRLPTGKPSPELLAELLQGLGADDPAVVQGPQVGVDVAIIDTGGPMLLVAKSDPITFATDAIGHYAVVVNSNDIATCGGRPRWMLATVLLPEGQADADMARDIFDQLSRACRRLGIALVGGHTEVTYDLDRPIVCGAMLGEVERGEFVTAAGAQAGDTILMTKAVAVEGTSIIARERGRELAERGFSQQFLRRCADFLYEPGISVLAEAQAAVKAGGVHAMHDPTEGGVAMGLWEMAMASGKRLVVDVGRIPVLPECARLCAEFSIDPLGLIASGTLLVCAEPGRADAVIEAVREAGVGCEAIGQVEDGTAEVVAVRDGTRELMPRYDQDELTRLL